MESKEIIYVSMESKKFHMSAWKVKKFHMSAWKVRNSIRQHGRNFFTFHNDMEFL
jgi:hypothetical protein